MHLHLHSPLPTMVELYQNKSKKHRHLVWTSAGLISVSVTLFALEILAPAGILGVIGALIQGIDAD